MTTHVNHHVDSGVSHGGVWVSFDVLEELYKGLGGVSCCLHLFVNNDAKGNEDDEFNGTRIVHENSN